MKAGGSNITPKHAEDISMSGLFLMEVTKAIDREFGVKHSTFHTTTNPWEDVQKAANHLSDISNNSPHFSDPTTVGLDKMFITEWIQNTLNRTELPEDPAVMSTDNIDHDDTDNAILYELSDTM